MNQEFPEFADFGMDALVSQNKAASTDESEAEIDLSDLPPITVDDRPVEEKWGFEDVQVKTATKEKKESTSGGETRKSVGNYGQ